MHCCNDMQKQYILAHSPAVLIRHFHKQCKQIIPKNKMWFRLRRAIVTYERHTKALYVPVGDTGRQVLRSCRSTLFGPSLQCSGNRRHQRWEDVVQSEREATVSAQSQVSPTVSTVSRCTGQLWTAAYPQRHRWPARFVDTHLSTHVSILAAS